VNSVDHNLAAQIERLPVIKKAEQMLHLLSQKETPVKTLA